MDSIYPFKVTLELNSKSNEIHSRLELAKLEPYIYIGGTGNFHYSFMSGFTGAISQLIINDRQLYLDTDSRLIRKLNVEYSSTCSNALCNNRGFCVRTQNRVGYKCLCEESEAVGANCEDTGGHGDVDEVQLRIRKDCMAAKQDVCRNGGYCSPNGVCNCPIGYSGCDCTKGIYRTSCCLDRVKISLVYI